MNSSNSRQKPDIFNYLSNSLNFSQSIFYMWIRRFFMISNLLTKLHFSLILPNIQWRVPKYCFPIHQHFWGNLFIEKISNSICNNYIVSKNNEKAKNRVQTISTPRQIPLKSSQKPSGTSVWIYLSRSDIKRCFSCSDYVSLR